MKNQGEAGFGAAAKFVKKYLLAENGEDIVLQSVKCEDGTLRIACRIGEYVAVLTPSELRRTADIAEQTMNTLPDDLAAQSLYDIILYFRSAADKIEATIPA